MKKIITLFCLTATLLFCFRTTCTAGSWTKISPSPTANDIYSVAYGNNCFIAIDCDYNSTPTISKIYKSTDYGQTWTQKTTMSGTTIYTVAYVNGKFIATDGNSGNGYYSTDDGNTWTQCQIADGSTMYGVTYGSSGYAAVRTEGNGYSDIYKSSDGISWSSVFRTPNTMSVNFTNIGYGNGTYVVVGKGALYTSTDAVTWTLRTNPSSQYFQGIAYGNGTFVAVAGSGTIIRSTDNGLTWSLISPPSGVTADINAVVYGNGYFYAVGNGGLIIKSTDGSSWSAETSNVTDNLWGIAYGNGYFVATGESGAITLINIPSKPTVITTAPSTVTSTSATLGGNVTEDGSVTVTERGIVYSLSSANTNPQIGGAGVTKVAYATGGKGSYSQTINPLSQGIAYSYNAYATNTKGTSYGDAQTFTINTISSITRSNSATTNTFSVSWTVTFAASVTGLTSTNFSLANTGLTSPSITGVTGSGTTWTVTASTGTGNGSLGLNLANSTGTSATFTNTLPFTGEVYTIDKTAPTVSSINRQTPSDATTAATSVVYRITFSKSVKNVAVGNFTLTKTGTANGTIASVNASTGTAIDVTVNSISGVGTLRLDLNSSGTGITDNAGNAITGGYTSGQTYTIATTGTFTGNISNDWATTGNWAGNAIPSSSTDVTIPSGKTVVIGATTQASCDDLTVNGSLTIQSSSSGTGTLITNGTVGGSGTTSVEQYLSSARNWYVSSPLSGANAPSGYTFFQYNEPGDNTSYTSPATAYWKSVSIGDGLAIGRGYIAQLASGTSTITFTGGTLNTGDKTLSLTRTTGKDKEGFNLVGNPYPSYLNIDDLKLNTDIEPSYWYRSKATNYVFDTYNIPSGITTENSGLAVTANIPPMQAFWLRVKSGKSTVSVVLKNANRGHQDNSNNKFRVPAASNETQKILRLQVFNGTNSDEAIIYFNPNAADEFDAYDSPKMSNGNEAIPEIYTLAGTEKAAINGFSNVAPNKEIALGFTTGVTNTFTIKATEISNFDADTKIILKDKLLNTEQELTAATDYSFSSDTVSTASRFSIVFKSASATTGIDNTTDNNAVNIFRNKDNQITINCNGGIDGTITVCNTLGQKLISMKNTGAITVIKKSFKSGVYVVTANISGKCTTRKVIIN